MGLLIVEKHVRLVGFKELGLVQAAKKYRFINTGDPNPESLEYPY